ncbi:MAG: hypothetical protein C0453_02235 [Comamonadaceae bacterium]|nr:hypothetical protein [Comamonadaceae bacterium]
MERFSGLRLDSIAVINQIILWGLFGWPLRRVWKRIIGSLFELQIMKCIIIFSFSLLINSTAFAQWAVYDQRVHEQLRSINNVAGNAASDFEEFEEHSRLRDDFSTVELADRTRYITTQEDCGDQQLNEKHYFSCQGLRNLRLKTLEQSEALLEVIGRRRDAINQLIQNARNANTEAGRLQRHQFELQGLQALIQNDAMYLQVLMDGYKQREKMYETQMAEARRVTDTRRPGSRSVGAVPFLPALLP